MNGFQEKHNCTKNEEKYEKKRATNTDTALNGFVREKYLDKCFPGRALSRGEGMETIHRIIIIIIITIIRPKPAHLGSLRVSGAQRESGN